MKIDRLDFHHVAMPLLYPWRTAYGEDYAIHSVLVNAVSGQYEAWSESSPLRAPTYLTESALSVFHHLTEFLGPHVLGGEYDTVDELNSRLQIFKGNSFAKAAIEMAWWTLQSKISDTPLHLLLGGATREVEAGADFGIQDSIDMLVGNVQSAVDAGFSRIKLKVAKGWDLEMLTIITGTFPNMTFHIDCNSSYTLEDLSFFKAIDKMGLAFIEQPLHYADVIDHAKLAKQIETPICLDESIIDIKSAEHAIEMNACKYINIKPARVGGLSNAVAIHDMAREAGIPVWVGGMLESAVGMSICVALATLPNFTYPGDLFPTSRFYERDLTGTSLELTCNNTFKPVMGSLPVPDKDMLNIQTIAFKSITAG